MTDMKVLKAIVQGGEAGSTVGKIVDETRIDSKTVTQSIINLLCESYVATIDNSNMLVPTRYIPHGDGETIYRLALMNANLHQATPTDTTVSSVTKSERQKVLDRHIVDERPTPSHNAPRWGLFLLILFTCLWVIAIVIGFSFLGLDFGSIKNNMAADVIAAASVGLGGWWLVYLRYYLTR